MNLEVLPDLDGVARRAAATIASDARAAVAARGRFLLALSGGTTVRPLLRRLAEEDVPWPLVDLFQVDERVAPRGSPDRNLADLEAMMLERLAPPGARLHAMPVEEVDLDAAAARYGQALREAAGAPAVLDLVHLGLGGDGHTASLVPGDPALDVRDSEVAVTRPYQGLRRMTLTYPVLDRARRVVWVVSGAAKREALARLRRGDQSIPAGRVRQDQSMVLADAEAVGASTA